MKKRDLESFFNAKSIAIVGASNNPKKVGNILMKKMIYQKGRVIPINLHSSKIEGIKAYKSLKKYPKKIDLVVIAIRAKSVIKVIKQGIKKKIKNYIIISAGFSEDGNERDSKKILKLKEKYNLNILGPNCFGIINPKKNVDLTFAKETAKKDDTVFISQSGALASYILDFGIKLRAFISLGNMLDLSFVDWIEYFNNDKKTKKIVCYIEKLKHGKEFIEACKKSKKEILVIKAGNTPAGKKATLSHTGSLATDERIYAGAFKQAKVKQIKTLAEAFKIIPDRITPLLKGKKILIITNAGGAGALVTDKLAKKGYSIDGPIDILGSASPADYKRELNKIKKNYDTIITILTPQSMSNPEETAKILINSKYRNKLVALFLGKKSIQKAAELLRKKGIPVATKSV